MRCSTISGLRETICPDSGLTCPRRATRGGEGINIADADSDEVRRYIIGAALRWMREFHADGLRLDAVHALVDTTAVPILEELATETDWLSKQVGRPLSLVAESDLNDPRLITPRDGGGYGITAQWDDDIHHAIHTAVSGERQGYYADFGANSDSMATLAHTLRRGFFHAGTYSSFRRRRHGRPLDTATIPATRLLAYTCTHDQVGNRALGDRPSQNLTSGQLAIKAALVLGSPYTAMLFMGEEWGPAVLFSSSARTPSPSWRLPPRRDAKRSSPSTDGMPTRSPIPKIRRLFCAPNWFGAKAIQASMPSYCASTAI
ncbi:Malto-oligosyltrehalose trehalohydrolase [Mycobacterium sp. 012931]|uniref:Glycosyl hydrolase family 13 catalytic domain-containing protein n=1 Tax=Mycobacterium pseudoshottsii TaxID=265949 RepID=A0A9N7LT58_9MYCO|nr:Malto-oligosyltrehalose trehalohydrolase [Mycobacterium sp. 012931]BDN82168.1 hypothetical protein NJB1907Z4_C23830 [Mycobacterium pseudoshottsii]